mgnify:CR=1 FL=1
MINLRIVAHLKQWSQNVMVPIHWKTQAVRQNMIRFRPVEAALILRGYGPEAALNSSQNARNVLQSDWNEIDNYAEKTLSLMYFIEKEYVTTAPPVSE